MRGRSSRETARRRGQTRRTKRGHGGQKGRRCLKDRRLKMRFSMPPTVHSASGHPAQYHPPVRLCSLRDRPHHALLFRISRCQAILISEIFQNHPSSTASRRCHHHPCRCRVRFTKCSRKLQLNLGQTLHQYSRQRRQEHQGPRLRRPGRLGWRQCQFSSNRRI